MPNYDGGLVELLRDVTQRECPWLDRTYRKGERMHLFKGATYGCITGTGVACFDGDDSPFYELPEQALSPVIPLEDAKET